MRLSISEQPREIVSIQYVVSAEMSPIEYKQESSVRVSAGVFGHIKRTLQESIVDIKTMRRRTHEAYPKLFQGA